jgi:phage terminase large subunit GpA-like protein
MLADAAVVVHQAWSDGWRLPPSMTVSAWADEHRRLSSKSSAEPGPWRTSRAPYMRQPMDDLSSESAIEEVVIMAAAQTGKTEAGNNWIGYTIDINPGPGMMVQPTLDMAKRYSKQRIQPMIDETPRLSERIAPARSRDSGNTTLIKEFDGGFILLTGANSAAGLRSMPVRDLFLDEIDAYPLDVDEEGDPISLAERRQTTFWRKKRLKTSTPTTKGVSRIEVAYETTEQSRYFVPCPHCHEVQQLLWSQLRWPEGQPREAVYVCPHCGAEIVEHHKTWMLERGEWRATRPEHCDPRRRGYHINGLYSPLGWKSWGECAEEFLSANLAKERGDISLLRAWTNTVLAETWEEQGDKVDSSGLSKRAEAYALRVVPVGVLLVVAGVDVQGDRLVVQLLGLGVAEEAWVADWTVIRGDPALAETWEQLHELLQRQITREDGVTLRVRAAAIDSGGHHTHEVYQFTRKYARFHYLAVKGSSQAARPILGKPSDVDIDYKGARIKRGARVWPVGTDTAKTLIYGRLRLSMPGPAYVHFSHELEVEYYEELTSERLRTKYIKGRPYLEWVKPAGKRNEGLDTFVYALAAAVYCGVTRWKLVDWQQLAARILAKAPRVELAPEASAEVSEETPQIETTDQQPAPEPKPVNTTKPRPLTKARGGFANAWRR